MVLEVVEELVLAVLAASLVSSLLTKESPLSCVVEGLVSAVSSADDSASSG